jgi:hypothetical protein
MRCSPCALRSLRCAAVISLAAAAGILRLDVESRDQAAEQRACLPNARAQASSADKPSGREWDETHATLRFRRLTWLVSRDVGLHESAAEPDSRCAAARPENLLSSGILRGCFVFTPSLYGQLSAGAYSFPFPAGPPFSSRRIAPPRRANESEASLHCAAWIAVAPVLPAANRMLCQRARKAGTPAIRRLRFRRLALRGESGKFCGRNSASGRVEPKLRS